MLIRAVGFLVISFNVMVTPAGAQQRLDLSLAPQWGAISDSHPPPKRSNDRYYRGSAAQNQPAPADGRDLSMDVRTQNGAPGTMSMGSVGLDSKFGDSYQATTGDDRYSASGAGLRLRIPIENDKSP